MYQHFFSNSEFLPFALAALLFFTAVFAGVVIRVVFAGSRQHHEALSRLPLSDVAEPREDHHG